MKFPNCFTGRRKALQAALWWKTLVKEILPGTGTGLGRATELNRKLLLLGEKGKIPLVATNDVHYLEREQGAHDVLLCIQTGKMLKR